MIMLLRGFGRATVGVLTLCTAASAQVASQPPQASNPVCVRLETQLATIDHNGGDAARADQIKRIEDAMAKEQADLDRTSAQARRAGCASQGFFALFSGLSPQCGPLTSKIQQMRSDIDRMMSDIEQVKSGGTGQESQRRAVIVELAQNNCGSQYTAAANAAGPRSFFDALFGNGTVVSPNGDGAPSGTYHTVCVRTCDGYYFPISYSTVPSRFADDQRACQRQCPASDAQLYTYRNPGESMDQAVSLAAQPYTALPNAFRYRKELVSGCSCRAPGQSWAEALRNADDSSTLEAGDIVVTDQRAKALSQVPPSASVKPTARGAQPEAAAAPPPAQGTDSANASPADPTKRKVRTVGPPFLSSQ